MDFLLNIATFKLTGARRHRGSDKDVEASQASVHAAGGAGAVGQTRESEEEEEEDVFIRDSITRESDAEKRD